jgi:hypothetical protein
VVTPSMRPVAASSLISATSAVSTKNFMPASPRVSLACRGAFALRSPRLGD